jgi:hypothetical protein
MIRELDAARERETLLLQMLQQMQQQNQRLLDMPHSTPAQTMPESRQDAPGATHPLGPSQRAPVPPQAPLEPSRDPRGDMRRRIVALLQEHPEGLTPGEMRALLHADKSLADTCVEMLRYGLVQRVERGRYVATESSRTERS